jgi:hypothetical protein
MTNTSATIQSITVPTLVLNLVLCAMLPVPCCSLLPYVFLDENLDKDSTVKGGVPARELCRLFDRRGGFGVDPGVKT